jgi:uncharacterized tellurite resistance protein B-like protein
MGFDAASIVRSTVSELGALDADTARSLDSLAFILMRVAEADRQITPDEVDRMEELLVQQLRLTPAQSVLAVEIARHRARLSDCGSAYGESRRLRQSLDPDCRQRILDCLLAVAAADGRTSGAEQAEILQIAAELGFGRDQVGFTGDELDT